MKKGTLAAGLRAAAHPAGPSAAAATAAQNKASGKSATVLIGGHFAPEVRRTLLLVQAEKANEGKNLRHLLGEAINDLCAKYGKPQPYREDH